MEQRKRESVGPKPSDTLTEINDPTDRGDLSGTFLRPVSELPPPAPVARIELKRRAVKPPPPPSLRVAPPPAAAAPRSMLPPPVPTTTPEPLSLRALVAPSYPPPPSTSLDTSERVDFEDFALRLDVAALPPPPASLLPSAPEVAAHKRSHLRFGVMALVLLLVGAGGWFARDISLQITGKQTVNAPKAAVATKPEVKVTADLVAQAPVEVAPPVEVAAQAPVEVAAPPVVIETPAVAKAAPTLNSVSTAVAREGAASTQRTTVQLPAIEQDVASDAVTVAAAAEPVAVAPIEAEGEHAPSLEEALAAEELPETLDRAEVIEGIELLRNEYQACAGDFHGTADIRLTIANTGRITHALVGGHFAGTPQGSCLARTLRQARFRPFQQARLDIDYPIAL